MRLDTQAFELEAPRAAGVAVQATIIGAMSGFMSWVVWHFRDILFAVFQRTHTDPLANDLRRRLFDLLGEKGPHTKRQLAQNLARSKQGVEFHLRILERAKLVSCDSTGVADVYYRVPKSPANATARLEKADVLAATHPVRQALWKQVSKNGETEFDELMPLAEAMVGNRASAARSLKYHTDVLVEAGLIRRERQGRSTRLILTSVNQDPTNMTESTSGI